MKDFDEKYLDGLQPDEAIAMLQCVDFMKSDAMQKLMRMNSLGLAVTISMIIECHCAMHNVDAGKFRHILVEAANKVDEKLGPYTIPCDDGELA